MTVFNFISMLGGLALFLYGMRIMGDALKKESSGSFKVALEKVTSNPFMGFVIGLGLTALIQSSTATIVIVSGLVGAGIMTLNQSLGVILGANVGTTVTGQIIRLLDVETSGTQWLNFFKPDTLAPLASVAGIIFIMFIKSRKSSGLGTILMGFGILFTGLINMTAAVDPLSEDPAFISFFMGFGSHPLLGFLAGFIVAFILQSSSASIGILQALSVTGAITFSSIYPMLLGIYLGDCVTTAIVCSIGTKADAKRAGMVNVMFNLGSMILVVAGVNICHSAGIIDGLWDSVLNSGAIANTHTVFKLVTSVLLLPLTKYFASLTVKIIKDDKPEKQRGAEIQAMDEALFKSPALALNSTYLALRCMNNMINVNLPSAVALVRKYDPSVFEELTADEEYEDELEDAVNAYLSHLSAHLNEGLQEDIQSYYLQCVTDFERAADHVYSIAECSGEIYDKRLSFSEIALSEMDVVVRALTKTLEYTTAAFARQDLESAKFVEPYVVLVNELTEKCREKHIERMKSGQCSSLPGSVYLDIMMHLGRVADMCSNIAISTLVRHSKNSENYEHRYMSSVHGGSDEKYNSILSGIESEYLSLL